MQPNRPPLQKNQSPLVIAGKSAGRRVTLNPDYQHEWQELEKAAKKGDYWANVAIKELTGLSSGVVASTNTMRLQGTYIIFWQGGHATALWSTNGGYHVQELALNTGCYKKKRKVKEGCANEAVPNLAPAKGVKAQEGRGFFRGAGSFFRGLSRYARHERRVMGLAGTGETARANTIEKMLLGEALGIALHANQTSIKAGGNRLLANWETIAGRQSMGLLGGAALGGAGAGPSLGIVAGMGDVYFSIESLALELKLDVSNVDYNRPILPQISDDALREYAERRLKNILNTFLSGQN
jgi:hypothetical protein